MTNTLVRLGAAIGNWNDRTFGKADTRAGRGPVWRSLDRLAGWLYTRRAPRTGD